MKSQERHKLKENDSRRRWRTRATALETRRRDHHLGLVGRRSRCSRSSAGTPGGGSRATGRATDLLASALAVYEAPVVPPAAPAPGSPAPRAAARHVPDASRRSSKRRCRSSSRPPTVSEHRRRHHRALSTPPASSPRSAATPKRSRSIRKSSRRRAARIYGAHGAARARRRAARAGQVRHRDRHLHGARAATRTSQLPLDGVLMQLGRACARAGKKEEAVRAFTRVVDEFPQSMYAGRREARARGSEEDVGASDRPRPRRTSSRT